MDLLYEMDFKKVLHFSEIFGYNIFKKCKTFMDAKNEMDLKIT